ncbi:MAG TPA: protein translocase subunit SecF [Acidimicrobiales bacterium]|nr:protein translocase subunit SecF [Acidimicrobiales bacterium]
MSDDKSRPSDDDSALDEVSDEDVEALEEDVDTEDLDEDELISLDDAARAMLARPRRGHGPIARLYRGETRFDFVGKRRIWFALSTIIILLGIVSIILRGGLNLGIEFKGGTEWTIAAPGVTATEASDAIKGTGVVDPTVELLGSGSKQTLTVQSDLNKLSQANQDKVSKNVSNAMLQLTRSHAPRTSSSATTTTAKSTTSTTKAGSSSTATTTATTAPASTANTPPADKISITTVGPTWGSSITNDAIKALIIFFIVVAIYISIRFEPKMALSAFIAMIHDVLVAIGIYSIFNFQVTPDTVVAILTILGYSLYDTVVVFDRVRDNTRGIGSSGRLTYPQLINLSMNQTLARSINTSAVAILPVLAVLLIGSNLLGATTLQSYGLALFVGLLSGAYSSIFIASPVLCMMKEREPRWVDIASRLAKRGDTGAFYSASDAATLGTQMSVAAAGQVSRGRGGPPAATKPSASKRSGLIRPGSGSRPGGSGSGGGAGTNTAVMERQSGGTGASGGSGQAAPGPRPRKGKGKRKR